MVEEHRIERHPGDGSAEQIDDMYDGEEYTTKDTRADTKTTFYERDIERLNVSPRRASELKRMLKRQEGQHMNASQYRSRGQQNHAEDKRRLIGTITSQLGMTRAQKNRVNHLVVDVISVNSFGHYSMEQVILAVLNVVAREDGRFIEEEQRFRDYMLDVEIGDERPDMATMKRLRGLVRERVPSCEER
jgi:hypothetical protein